MNQRSFDSTKRRDLVPKVHVFPSTLPGALTEILSQTSWIKGRTLELRNSTSDCRRREEYHMWMMRSTVSSSSGAMIATRSIIAFRATTAKSQSFAVTESDLAYVSGIDAMVVKRFLKSPEAEIFVRRNQCQEQELDTCLRIGYANLRHTFLLHLTPAAKCQMQGHFPKDGSVPQSLLMTAARVNC